MIEDRKEIYIIEKPGKIIVEYEDSRGRKRKTDFFARKVSKENSRLFEAVWQDRGVIVSLLNNRFIVPTAVSETARYDIIQQQLYRRAIKRAERLARGSGHSIIDQTDRYEYPRKPGLLAS